ncbi:MAG: hypothetical protein RLZZ133_704, partial [Pseudomonadota bacterium]
MKNTGPEFLSTDEALTTRLAAV